MELQARSSRQISRFAPRRGRLLLFLKLSVFAVQTYLAYAHLRREGWLALSRLLWRWPAGGSG